MIETGPMTALVALTTLCTVLYIGLGFLPHPGRATAVWSSALAGLMVAAYTWVAANQLDSQPLRGAASGFMFSMIAVVWVGLRVHRQAERTFGAIAALVSVAAPVLLILTATSDGYLTMLRLVIAITSVFAALTVAELLRLSPLRRDEIVPLALASAAFVAFAVVNAGFEVARLVGGGEAPDPARFSVVRDISALGALMYVVCATVTLLLLTRDRAGESVRTDLDSAFARVASDRLRRAAATDDKWWALLVIRLDDPAALQQASSAHAYAGVRARFAEVVQAALPADADLDVRDGAAITVLLPRPEGAVRQILANLLEHVALTDSDLAVRLSASIGWAGVDVVGYDLDALVAEAADAATLAQERGGDRWFRVTVS